MPIIRVEFPVIQSALESSAMASKSECPIVLLGLEQIVVDHQLQSRVNIDMEHQKYLSECVYRGDVPAPVVVFFDGETYLLADGFHRHGAYTALAKADPGSFGQIRAEVRPGSRNDAMIFSAGANQKTLLPRSKEDKKKAVWMLMEFEDWRQKSFNSIARHTGIPRSKIFDLANEWYATTGVQKPSAVAISGGGILSTDRPLKGDPRRKLNIVSAGPGRSRRYQAYIGGKNISIGTVGIGLAEAERRLEEKLASQDLPAGLECYGNLQSTRKALIRRLVLADCLSTKDGLSCPGLTGMLGNGFVAATTDFGDPKEAVLAVGRVILARAAVGAGTRMVVLCEPEKGPEKILELGRVMGIEFLTIDDFVASFAPQAKAN
jgi:hypothetical protein